MTNNLKTWAPLAVAIVLGGIAAKIGHDMLGRKPAERVVVQKVTHVVAAREDLAAGSALRAQDLMVNTVADSTVPPGAFDAPERLTNRVTTVGLRKGQPIYENMLAPEGTSKGLTAIVPEGMRAVTMEINETSGVAGLIVPGCRVDVVTSLPGENGQMMSRTIARSLQIVAVGRRYGDAPHENPNPAAPQNDADTPMARSVTLLVTPKQAEILDLATHTGSPRLILRGSRDSKDSSDYSSDGVTVGELRGVHQTWTTMLAQFFQPMNLLAQQAAGAATSQPTKGLFASPQPDKNYRQVQIIRRTQEQTQQVEVPKESHLPNVANTDNTEAVPGSNSGNGR